MVSIAGQETKFLICTLSKQICQVPLNLHFLKGCTAKFMCNGKGYVHLTGYFKRPFAESDDELKRSSTEEDKEGEKRTSLKKKVNLSKKDSEKCSKSSKKKTNDNDETWEKTNTDDDYDDSDDSEYYKLDSDTDYEDEEVEEEEEEDDDYYDDLYDNYFYDCDDIEMNESEDDTIEQEKSEDQKKKVTKVTEKKNKEKQIKKEKSNDKILIGDVKARNMEIGTGKVAEMGKKVTIYYRSRVKLGEKNPTISECLEGDGFSFQVGSGHVMPGVNAGIIGMKVGGKRSLVIPPRMAYV